MIGIHGVGDAPDVNGPRASTPKSRPVETSAPRRSDEVAISPEAAARSRLQPAPSDAETIRAERIERAKQNIQDGAYRLQDVVLQVAQRIAPYVES